jgi:glycine hydroxymethyltransferase
MMLLTSAHIPRPVGANSPLTGFGTVAAELLAEEDPQLHDLLCAAHGRLESQLSLLSDGVTDPSVLACMATIRSAPRGARDIDAAAIEEIAVARALTTFGARYADVRPHSAAAARHAVLSALAEPRDTILAVLPGHGTDPAGPFRWIRYDLRERVPESYERISELAQRIRPRVIMCVASDHPRTVDFGRLRTIADSVGAWLLADISPVAGLVVTGLHPSPIDHAHITTTCTHIQLAGPHGGLILSGKDADTPIGQGTLAARLRAALADSEPLLPAMAGKARALGLTGTPAYQDITRRIVSGAVELAEELTTLGHPVLTGGTDDHLVVLDLSARELSGPFAERALEEVNIVVDSTENPDGVWITTNTIAYRGFAVSEVRQTAQLVDAVVNGIRPSGEHYQLEAFTRLQVRDSVRRLISQFPLPRHVPVSRP